MIEESIDVFECYMLKKINELIFTKNHYVIRVCYNLLHYNSFNVLQYVTMCYNVLRCLAMRYNA